MAKKKTKLQQTVQVSQTAVEIGEVIYLARGGGSFTVVFTIGQLLLKLIR